jgi:hypothetical protein
MKLSVKQTICLDFLEDETTNEVFYGGAAGGGKSAIGTYWLGKCCLKFKGSRWLMGREELETLRGTTLKSFNKEMRKQGVYPDVHYRLSGKTIFFNNGSEIVLSELKYYPSDEDFDYLGSMEITGAFVDESPQITHKAKEVLKSRMRFNLDSYCHICGDMVKKKILKYDENNKPVIWICNNNHRSSGLIPKLLMTGNPSKKWPYITFYKPSRDGSLPDDKRFVQALPGENENLPQAYIDMLKGLDKKTRARLERGEWEYEDDPTSLMAYDDITAIFTNYHVKGTGKRYISADVARYGKDDTKIRVWDGFKVIHKVIMSKSSIVEVADKIKEVQSMYQVAPTNTVIDEDGIGGGVVDLFPKNSVKGFIANSRPVNQKPNENYENLKAQCSYLLAEKVGNYEIYEPEANPELMEMLIEDLEQIKAKDPDKDGKRGIVAKEKVKEVLGRSPDDGDTYLMRMYFEVNKSGGLRIIN